MHRIRLGLIGDNIRHSRSPALHRLAGEICSLDVSYDLLVPAERELEFDALFNWCRERGYRGVNVTYPYKERVFVSVEVDDLTVRQLGACNTVLFGEPLKGDNTDFTGFRSAFRDRFGACSPGKVAMAGAGGVGRAISFALAQLEAESIAVFDRDGEKAERLVAALKAASPSLLVRSALSIEDAMDDADGFVNSTPVGMTGYPGVALPAACMPKHGWAFDAVYTPVDTEFLISARAAGLEVMSGYELFFHQGVDAFRLFTGLEPDTASLRKALEAEELEASA